MTAGDTAAITAPIIAASNIETCNRGGANKITLTISILAGTKHIRIAGRPTFFSDFKSRDNPARVKIITKANFLKSGDIKRIEPSNKLNA